MSPKEIAERIISGDIFNVSKPITDLARAYLELVKESNIENKNLNSNEATVKLLREEIAKLKSSNAGLIEALKFYADRNNWKCWDTYTDVKDVITVSDLGCKSYSEKADYAIPSGGRRANEALKKWGGV